MIRLLVDKIDYCFDLSSEYIQNIVIEDKKCFRSMIESFITYDSSIKMFSDVKELNLSKTYLITTDLIDYEVNSKKILNKIISDMESFAVTTNMLETNKLLANISNYIDSLVQNSDLFLEYDDIDIKDVIKNAKIRISTEEGYVSKLLDYIKASIALFNYKVFIFLNLYEFVSQEEIQEIYEWTSNNDVIVIVLSSKEHSFDKNYEKTGSSLFSG